MVVNTNNYAPELPKWFERICKSLYRRRKVILGTSLGIITLILLPIVTNLVSSLLTTPFPPADHTLMELVFKWIFSNLFVVILLTLLIVVLAAFVVLLTYLGYLFEKGEEVQAGKNSEVQLLSDLEKDCEEQYLQHLITKTTTFVFKGIPLALAPKNIQLDKIFISLQFRSTQTLMNYPMNIVDKDQLSSVNDREEEDKYFKAEMNWQTISKYPTKISIIELWHMLRKEQPAVLIQGNPGSGKSILIARLVLNMARSKLNQPDLEMPKYLEPSLMPIILDLKAYAIVCRNTSNFSLSDYLEQYLEHLSISGIAPLIQKYLQVGQCLIFFDGLDEISNQRMRAQTQTAIKTFIDKQRKAIQEGDSFNRFIIISRVAGYIQAAFPDYIHYTISELTFGQIQEFLRLWIHADIDGDVQRIRQLLTLVESQQNIYDLAENPLFLTLLIVLRIRNKLPQQAVEIYGAVASALLENSNREGLPVITEDDAIKRLGPIALWMQEKQLECIPRSIVLNLLSQTHQLNTLQDGEQFLHRMNVHGGIFISRTGDYFGFFHHTIQDYIAARFMLYKITLNHLQGIEEIVSHGHHSGRFYRKPFVLAVCYAFNKSDRVGSNILQKFLSSSIAEDTESQVRDLLLAAECLIEAKSSAGLYRFERQIIQKLLQIYEDAQQRQRLKLCDQIEGMFILWLQRTPNRTGRSLPELLTVLDESVNGMHGDLRQRTTLTLLVLVVRQLKASPSLVFDTLIPSLLKLAGIPKPDEYNYGTHIFELKSNMRIADLALTVLSFMGEKGPAGLLLKEVKKYFLDHPEQIRLLVHYSLESRTLLTPTVVPQTADNSYIYDEAIREWRRWLNENEDSGSFAVTNQHIEQCRTIHETLLNHADEVRYPAALYLLELLNFAKDRPTQPWGTICTSYLSAKLNSCHYIHYQEIVLLWEMLNHGEQARKTLVELIIRHYMLDDEPIQRYAQYFLTTFSNYLRGVHYWRYLRDLLDISDLRDLADSPDCLQNLRYLRKPQSPQEIRLILSEPTMRLREAGDVSPTQYLLGVRDRFGVRNLLDLRELRRQLLTKEIAEKARIRLTSITENPVTTANLAECIDLLVILLGRILHMIDIFEVDSNVEQEVKQVVEVVLSVLGKSHDDEMREAALDIIRFMPVRTIHEIKFVQQLAETNHELEQACAEAFRRAEPRSHTDREALKECGESKSLAIRAAVAKRLEREIYYQGIF